MACLGEKCIEKLTGKTALGILQLPDDAAIEEIYERSIQLATPYHPQNNVNHASDLEFRLVMHSGYSALFQSINQTCRHKQCKDLEYLLRDFSCLGSCLLLESHQGNCNENFYLNLLGNFHFTYKKFSRKQLRQIRHYFLTATEVRELGMFYDELVKLQKKVKQTKMSSIQRRVDVQNKTRNPKESSLQSKVDVQNETRDPRVSSLQRKVDVQNETRDPKASSLQRKVDVKNETRDPKVLSVQRTADVENETRDPRVSSVQRKADVENETRDPKVLSVQRKADVENETRDPRVSSVQRKADVENETRDPRVQRKADVKNETRDPRLLSVQRKDDVENETRDPKVLSVQRKDDVENETRDPRVSSVQRKADVKNETRDPKVLSVQRKADAENETRDPKVLSVQRKADVENETRDPKVLSVQRKADVENETRGPKASSLQRKDDVENETRDPKSRPRSILLGPFAYSGDSSKKPKHVSTKALLRGKNEIRGGEKFNAWGVTRQVLYLQQRQILLKQELMKVSQCETIEVMVPTELMDSEMIHGGLGDSGKLEAVDLSKSVGREAVKAKPVLMARNDGGNGLKSDTNSRKSKPETDGGERKQKGLAGQPKGNDAKGCNGPQKSPVSFASMVKKAPAPAQTALEEEDDVQDERRQHKMQALGKGLTSYHTRHVRMFDNRNIPASPLSPGKENVEQHPLTEETSNVPEIPKLKHKSKPDSSSFPVTHGLQKISSSASTAGQVGREESPRDVGIGSGRTSSAALQHPLSPLASCNDDSVENNDPIHKAGSKCKRSNKQLPRASYRKDFVENNDLTPTRKSKFDSKRSKEQSPQNENTARVDFGDEESENAAVKGLTPTSSQSEVTSSTSEAGSQGRRKPFRELLNQSARYLKQYVTAIVSSDTSDP